MALIGHSMCFDICMRSSILHQQAPSKGHYTPIFRRKASNVVVSILIGLKVPFLPFPFGNIVDVVRSGRCHYGQWLSIRFAFWKLIAVVYSPIHRMARFPKFTSYSQKMDTPEESEISLNMASITTLAKLLHVILIRTFSW